MDMEKLQRDIQDELSDILDIVSDNDLSDFNKRYYYYLSRYRFYDTLKKYVSDPLITFVYVDEYDYFYKVEYENYLDLLIKIMQINLNKICQIFDPSNNEKNFIGGDRSFWLLKTNEKLFEIKS